MPCSYRTTSPHTAACMKNESIRKQLLTDLTITTSNHHTVQAYVSRICTKNTLIRSPSPQEKVSEFSSTEGCYRNIIFYLVFLLSSDEHLVVVLSSVSSHDPQRFISIETDDTVNAFQVLFDFMSLCVISNTADRAAKSTVIRNCGTTSMPIFT